MSKGYRMDNNPVSPDTERIIKPPKKADGKFVFIMVQIITSIIFVLFVLCLKYVGGDVYEDIKAWYKNNFNEETHIEQVIEQEETAQFSETKLLSAEIGKMNTISLPVDGTTTSNYGYRVHPIYNKNLMHYGVDISAESGTKIKSVMDGIVTECGYNSSYGNYIKIEHSDSLSTLYAHCEKIISKEKDKITKGQPVAVVGSTGVSTGPHVHFEVRLNDKAIDPGLVCDIK